MTKARLTRDVVQRFADLGMTQSQAAEELGVSLGSVSGLACRHSITFVKHFDPMARAFAYRQFAERGLTAEEVALELSVSVSHVRRSAQKFGVQFMTERDRRRQQWTHCAERGLTAVEAAHEMGVNVKAAYEAAAKYEFTFKRMPRSGVTDDERAAQMAARSVEKVDIPENGAEAMAQFWRRTRNCAVPLTFPEFRRGLDGVNTIQAREMLQRFWLDGFIEIAPADKVRIYTPTAGGAKVARAMFLREVA